MTFSKKWFTEDGNFAFKVKKISLKREKKMTRRVPESDKIASEIGKRLRTVRKKLKLTIIEFAEKMGVFFTQYSRYEKGQDFLVSNLYRIKKAIPNLNIDWLVSGEGEMFIDVPHVPSEMLEESEKRGDYIVIPWVLEKLKPFVIPEEYLKRYLRIEDCSGLKLFPADEKRTAVVKKENAFFDGKMYLLKVERLFYLRRVYFDPQRKKMFLRNSSSAPEVVLDWDGVDIVGRVVGYISISEEK